MNCPKCQNEMEIRKIGTVTVDECVGCKGVWFDKDELRLSKDQKDPGLNWLDFELWKQEDKFRVSEKPISCPKCNVNMNAITYGDTEVEVDYCVSCNGVWLDGGEFEKIIEALTEEVLSKSSGDYVKASLTEAKEIITGPEGLLSEWSDFLTVLKFLETRFFVENPKLLDILQDIQRSGPK